MTEHVPPIHDIGDTVYVLCKYDYYGTLSLLKTTVIAWRVGETGAIGYEFAGWNPKDNVNRIWKSDQEAEARKVFAEQVTARKHAPKERG